MGLWKLLGVTACAMFGVVTVAQAANPITTAFYSADAAALVHNDSLFIFAGHDEQGAQGTNNKFFLMNDWHVLVTTDMENYHDYGAVLSYKTFKWADASAFAGHCEYRNGKYYWYVAVHHGSIKQDEGFAIGVAVADHPSGPWVDAIGHALVTDLTENDVKLNIDPAIFYDGDDIWMYWGSWNAGRRVKLKENMIELASKPEDIGIKDFFEAPWMHKFRGNYYFSYASGYPSTTNYSMAPSINGPWTQKGVINAKEDNSETNHQAIFKYMGHWYFMHHGANSPGGWTYRRSVNIDYLYYDRDGNIQKIVRTDGVDKVNNALIKDGAYRLTVSHSNLALQDDGDMVIQQTADETADNQLWIVAAGKTARHYTLQNYGTKKYYCPQAVLLDTVRTSATPCEIRIENASEKKGYYLFANYDDDYLGDILNVSKEPGMPLITWVRSGTDNQKIQFVSSVIPSAVEESSSSSDVIPDPDRGSSSSSSVIPSSSSSVIPSSSSGVIPSAVEGSSSSETSLHLATKVLSRSMNYDPLARMVRLAGEAHWTVFSLNGHIVQCGFGSQVSMNNVGRGTFLVRSGKETLKVVNP
ncbi:glycoside hydrolase family 43 protein [Fibrobacter sp. UWEL]|uniref:glycoside hydrolase family 43 protein n=1 Tax=Fibrobacter sp. UWEL TaxID=1896209 RepID=UPI00091ABD34|nr:glycoside hydrolase family 43 protein [Fibrobacter sp. UWEL]SHK45376.1 Glycosyl hydrolases family 43 [Fibrobacter sp. UWEL]